ERQTAPTARRASPPATASAPASVSPPASAAQPASASPPASANGRGAVSSTRVPATPVPAALNGHATRSTFSSPPVPEQQTSAPAVRVDEPDAWDERVAGALRFLRRRITGQYEVDDFGFDPDLTDNLLHPLLRLMYRYYFRVEAFGAENLPPDGSALIVANHS